MTARHIRISRMQLSVVDLSTALGDEARRRPPCGTSRISRLSLRRGVTVCRLPLDRVSRRRALGPMGARRARGAAELRRVGGVRKDGCGTHVRHRRISLVAPPLEIDVSATRWLAGGGVVRGRCGCRSSTSAAARPRPRRRAACRAGRTAARRSTGHATGVASEWPRGTHQGVPPSPTKKSRSSRGATCGATCSTQLPARRRRRARGRARRRRGGGAARLGRRARRGDRGRWRHHSTGVISRGQKDGRIASQRRRPLYSWPTAALEVATDGLLALRDLTTASGDGGEGERLAPLPEVSGTTRPVRSGALNHYK